MKKLFVAIIILLLIFCGVCYIDYFLVKTKGSFPKIAIKKVDKDKHVTIYNAVLYKVWYCEDENKILIGGYGDPDNQCSNPLIYKDGYYINESNVKISKQDYDILISEGIYTNDMINIMLNNKEVNDAVYVANNYMLHKYEIVEEEKNYLLVVFPELKEKKNNYIWVYPENEDSYYCLFKKDGREYYSKYENGKCSNEEKLLEYDQKWCSLYKSSTLVFLEEDNGLFCKE